MRGLWPNSDGFGWMLGWHAICRMKNVRNDLMLVIGMLHNVKRGLEREASK